MPQNNYVKATTQITTAPPEPPDYLTTAGIPADGVPFVGLTAVYSSSSEMLDAGFLSTDDAYLAAVQYFGQDDTTSPSRLVIIAKGSYTAQVTDLEVTDNDDGVYNVYIALLGGGALVLASTFTASGNTLTQIRNGLITNWTATDQTPTSQGAATIRITAATAGAPFLASGTGPTVSSFADADVVTPNVGPYEEMDDAFDDNPFWDVIPDPSEPAGLMLEWSRWAEASKEANSERRNAALIQVVDPDIADAVSPNTAEVYEALGRTRTFLIVHANATDKGGAIAHGKYGGLQPGVRAWHLREISGTSETTGIKFTYTQVENLKAAQVGYFERFVANTSQAAMFQWGQGSGGFFIEHKLAEDYWWLMTRARLLAAMQSLSGVNISDSDIARLVAVINTLNIELAGLGIIDLERTVVTPKPVSGLVPGKVALGKYTPTDGGIEVSTVLINKLRELEVTATFATS